MLVTVSAGAAGELWEVTDEGFDQIATGAFEDSSADGSRVYFISQEGHDPADLDADWDAYEVGPGGYRLLSDPAFGVTDLIEVSDDGQRWLLLSYDALTGDDTDAGSDVWLMRTGEAPELLTGVAEQPLQITASEDASTLFYRTTSAVLPGDADAADDLYRWKPGVGTTLVTPGTGTASVAAMSPAGDRVILSTGMALRRRRHGRGHGPVPLHRGHDVLAPDAGRRRGDVRRHVAGREAGLPPIEREAPAGRHELGLDLYVSDLDVTPPTLTVTGPKSGPSTSRATPSGA